ncbi:YlzJ-like family protein [Bacillus niameyensis]|uniref:YlzJ-like family protein n=1 Tax=Bacillus niameyensis TaxID=1522308 RepID=UPI000782A887|nr:YlzJ-like family protein [Bacillus niameyensis]
MILHTIVPPELIFPDNDQGFQNQNTIIRQGIPLVVEQDGNMYKVVRIMSSNPSDFLRNDLCPGAYIPLYE